MELNEDLLADVTDALRLAVGSPRPPEAWGALEAALDRLDAGLERADAASVVAGLRELDRLRGTRVATSLGSAVEPPPPIREYVNRLVHGIQARQGQTGSRPG